MLRVERHGDVTRLVLSTRASRLIGYDVSAYLVETGAGRVLVDTGCPGAWRDLRRLLAEAGGGAPGRAVAGACVTHQHEDHAGNAAALAAAGVPLAMSAATRAAVRHVPPPGLYRDVTWGRMRAVPDDAPAFDPAPLALVATPGHSPDHHAVWDPERATLYGGDLFLGVKVRVAHPGEDLGALARSLRAAAALGPRRLFDGHRGLVPDPRAALEAKAAWVEDTVARVEALLARGWPERRVRAAVLGRESLAGYASGGHYSRGNFVRAVRDRLGADRGDAARPGAPPPGGGPQPSTPNSRAASRS
jgi:glyoxylase-like metal-dependent hydrolase (beta-lactamase superfamily II)